MLPGRLLAEQLQAAIEECPVCILLATPASLRAKWCLAEVGAFWGAAKRVIIFIADPSVDDKAELPPQFQGNLWTNDAAQLIPAVTEAFQEDRERRRLQLQGNTRRENPQNSTRIDPRSVEALSGRWTGCATQAHGHAGENYTFPISFGLVATERRVFGTFEIEYPKDGQTEKAILSCSGGFFYGAFLRLVYEHVDERKVHFGAIMAHLRPASRKLVGRFLGYGDITEDIVYGRFEVSKCDTENVNSSDSGMFFGKVEWNRYKDQIRNLRNDAFCVEEGFTPSFINDERDTSFSHVCALADDRVVGCVRYAPDGRIERFAINKEFRGKAFHRLWTALVEQAKAEGIRRVFGAVQEKYMPLYQRVGCRVTGRSHLIDSIEHCELENFL